MRQGNTNTAVASRFFTLLFSLVIFATSLSAQIKKGDKMFSKFEYEKALVAYEKEYNETTTANPYLTRRIGLTYRNLGDIESSAIWFKRTLDLDTSNKYDYLYYAEALKYLQEYEKSMEYYELFASKSPNDNRAIEHLNNPNYYEKLLTDTSQFTVKRLKMNTENASFGIAKYKDKYLYSSTGRPNPEVTQNYNMFDDNPYLDIFVADRDEDAELVNVKRIKGEINSKYHDGPIAYDNNRGQLYVTRNNIKRGRPVKDNAGRVNLKVYVFEETSNGEWGKGEELSFNSDDYSVAHPSISVDGNVLYFSSNQVGGYGGTDIYVSKRKESGAWGEPLNLGPQINTEGDESFPFISSEGNLFFSSDGHPGLGGLDVFKTMLTNGKWMEPINLAHPINSEKDDISFVTELDEKSGYFSSNRNENQIGDDIYSFQFTPIVKINAFVRDKFTLLPIEGVIAKIYDEGGFVVFEGESDENGYLEVSVIKGKCNYTMKVGEEMDVVAYNFDLNICDEENKIKDNLDLGFIEFGDMEYQMTLSVEDVERNKIVADIHAKIYDDETKELLFESLVADNGKIAYALQPDKTYRLDVTSDNYEMVSRKIDPTDFSKDGVDVRMTMNEIGSIANNQEGSIKMPMSLSVKDVERNNIVADVHAKIYDEETKELLFESLVADNGKIAYALQPDKSYRVDLTSDEYEMVSRKISPSDFTKDGIDVNVTMNKIGDIAENQGGNSNAVASVNLDNIYYDFDKSNIRSDAKVVLDNLVGLMKNNPEVKIKLDSHTDSRGTNSYNMSLSERREKSAMNYLINAGIDASRLTNEHFGEEQLANNCTDKVKCSEDDHQLNRRTTFTILNPEAFASNIGSKDAKTMELSFDDLADEGVDYDQTDVDFDFMFAA